MGIPIAWRSKGQKSVTLSSSEAELVACSEVLKEVVFVDKVLSSLGIKVKKPIVVQVDNQGAIFLANNLTTADSSKHIDVRNKFIHEYVDSGFIKILYVPTAENDADLWTKNVSGELFEKHSEKVVWEASNCQQEGC